MSTVPSDDCHKFYYKESLLPLASGIRRYDTLPTPHDKPHNLPDKLVDIYEALLDFYSFHELESFRTEYGDHILWQIYNDEVAPFYHY